MNESWKISGTTPSVSSSDGHSSGSPQSSLVIGRSLAKSPTSTTYSGQVSSSPVASLTQPYCATGGTLGESDDPEFHSASDTPKKLNESRKKTPGTPSTQRLTWSSQQFLSRHRQKNSEMHKLFKELPESEKLLDDYSCALQREILAQGRMYLTQSYLCFYANIFTWETLLIIPLTKIQSMTKERTAYVFPNAIQVSSSSDKYTFSSFIQRDTSYQVLFRLWQNALLNFPMPLTDLYVVARKSWGDPHKFNSESDIWGPTHGSSLSQSSLTKMDVMEKTVDTRSQKSAASFSTHTTSDEEVRRLTEASRVATDSTSVGDIPPKHGKLLTPESTNSPSRIRSKSATLAIPPNTVPNSVNSLPSQVSTSVGDDSLKASGSSSEPKDRDRHSTPLVSSGSADVSQLGEGEVNGGSTNGDQKEGVSVEGARATPMRSSRGNTVVGDNDSQLSHPLLIIRDGHDLQSINESLLSSEFETTSIADAGEVLCGCDDHDGCLVINDVFNVNVEVMFQMLFTDSEFMREFLKSRNVSNIEFGQWQDLAEGTRVRDISYTLNLNYSFGPKYSPTTERQVYSKLGQPGLRHIVELEVNNSNIPHGDKFYTKVKVCITRVTHNSSRLRVTSNIAFRKSCWSVVKTLIERNAGDGIRNHYSKLEANLKEYIPTMTERRKTHKTPSMRGLKRKRKKGSLGSRKEAESAMGNFHRPGHSRNTSDVSGNLSFNSMLTSFSGDPSRQNMVNLRSSQSNLVSGIDTRPNSGASLTNRLSLWLLIVVAVLVTCNMGLYYILMRYQPTPKPAPYTPYSAPSVDSWPSTEEDWKALLNKMEESHNEKLQLYETVLTEVLTAVREVEVRMGQVFDSTSRLLQDQLKTGKEHSYEKRDTPSKGPPGAKKEKTVSKKEL